MVGGGRQVFGSSIGAENNNSSLAKEQAAEKYGIDIKVSILNG